MTNCLEVDSLKSTLIKFTKNENKNHKLISDFCWLN